MSKSGFLGDVDEKGRDGGVGPARAQKSTVHDPQNPKPEEIKDRSTSFSEMQEGKTDWVANTVPSSSACRLNCSCMGQERNRVASDPESCAEVIYKSCFPSVIWEGMKGPLTHFLDSVKKMQSDQMHHSEKNGQQEKRQ